MNDFPKGYEVQGQMSMFDLMESQKSAGCMQKTCAATLKTCDCHCGYEKCCQYCIQSCENRCKYSANQPEVLDGKGWKMNPDHFDPLVRLAMRGTGYVNGKKRVFAYFKEKHTSKEKVDFLKNEYGVGGFGIPKHGERNIVHQAMYDAKGIKYEYNDSTGQTTEDTATWNDMRSIIELLINKGWYVPDPSNGD